MIAGYGVDEDGKAWFFLDVNYVRKTGEWFGIDQGMFSDPVFTKWSTLASIIHEGDHYFYKSSQGIPFGFGVVVNRHEIEPPAYAQEISFLRAAANYERSRGNSETANRLETFANAVEAKVAQGAY